MNKETRLKIAKLEDEILDLVRNHDGITNSDLQGIVSVIVNKIYETGVTREGLSFEQALQMHKEDYARKFM